MIKVVIKNLQGIQTHGAQFSTQGEVDAWILVQKEQHSWGKPTGEYPLSQLSEAELSTEISRRTESEAGPLLEPLVTIPDQFIVEQTDITLSHALTQLRLKRDQLLAECDYIMMPDYPMADKSAWVQYRQALRDLPSSADPLNPIWPSKPE